MPTFDVSRLQSRIRADCPFGAPRARPRAAQHDAAASSQPERGTGAARARAQISTGHPADRATDLSRGDPARTLVEGGAAGCLGSAPAGEAAPLLRPSSREYK